MMCVIFFQNFDLLAIFYLLACSELLNVVLDGILQDPEFEMCYIHTKQTYALCISFLIRM